jgi:hypothetical protein
MITKEQIRKIRHQVMGMQPPVLSMYLVEDQSNPHERRVRARATMSSLGVPDAIAQQVMGALEIPENRAPTVAVFANQDSVNVLPLPMELPVVDPRTGHVEARWGGPYLTPLVLALDQCERFIVALIGRDSCRTFEVYLGEIDELHSAVRASSPGELDDYMETKETAIPYLASRDNAWKDRMERHTMEWVRRFYEMLGSEIDQEVVTRGIDRLILLGPERDLTVFQSVLSKPVQDRIVAMEPGLPDPDAPASMVLERVWPTIERVQMEETKRVIDDAENQGARGTAKCLAELQQNRVHTVVAPWNLDDEVYETSNGYVMATEDQANKVVDGNGRVRKVPLKDVLPTLASAYGARLTFARGENERRLQDLGGMCGLLRW